MTIYAFPDPRPAVSAVLNAAKAAHWPTATISGEFPQSNISVPHIQYAWDGTPLQQSNRQGCAIRVTVWAPKLQTPAGIALAQLVLAVLLDSGTGTIWRFTPGAGPLPGTDDDTKLPFCTFTVTAETRPAAVS